MTTGRINQVARPLDVQLDLCPPVHRSSQAEATTKLVVVIEGASSSYLIEDRRRMLRILPRNCGEVEATPVPGVLKFGELLYGRVKATKRAKRLYRERHPKPTAGARFPW
jgi:hypothetical protein